MAAIVITINTDGAALNDDASRKTEELIRILRNVVGRLNGSGCSGIAGMVLRDSYDLNVGTVELID